MPENLAVMIEHNKWIKNNNKQIKK